MDKPKATPKDFFLWAGAMLALYVGVFNYIALVWDYINYAIPDTLTTNYFTDPYQSGISWEMATLIIVAPVFLILMQVIRRTIAKDSTRKEIWVRHWALYLTLFVAGATVVVDLVWVLYAFLNGTDMTTHFLLKALVVLLVASVGFMHFIADLWGYWEQYPNRNRMVLVATVLLIVATVAAGFFIVGTPAQARLYRLDAQKVSDLQNIQYQVANYYQLKQKLPTDLSEVADPLSGTVVPMDTQLNQAYAYRITTPPYSFEVCATFNAASTNTSVMNMYAQPTTVPTATHMGGDSWAHGVGQACFERTIDPARYPSNQTNPLKPVPVQ